MTRRRSARTACLGAALLLAMGLTSSARATATSTPTSCDGAFHSVPVHNPGSGFDALFGIDGAAPGDVWAVGARDLHADYQPLIEHWNGSTWRVVGAGRSAEGAVLLGVAMRTADDGWAVGASPGPGASILHWDGDRWTRVPDAPTDYERGDVELDSVTATGPDDGWAAGTRDVTGRD